jgi:hypothetical protein
MTPNKILKKIDIDKDDINRITALCPVREKAFFTIMRQSGLPPHIIKKLRIKNVETNTPIPCKIDLPQETRKPPAFIGEEAVKYLNQYLATRKNLSPESLLFTIRNDPNKEINTKDVSRTFRLAAEKIVKTRVAYDVEKGKTNRPRLFSLINFFRNNAKHYLKELQNNPLEGHELFRSLYQKHAMPFLEIETQITIQIYQTKKRYQKEIENQNIEIKEMRQSIAKDNEYISSILTLLYNNKGDYETGENIELGNHFIELWRKTEEEQRRNLIQCWTRKTKLLPYKDILEELTKTLESIMKPYEELKKLTDGNDTARARNWTTQRAIRLRTDNGKQVV